MRRRSRTRPRCEEGSVQAENADPLSLPLNTFFLIVIFVSISLVIAWSTGYSTARDQRRFLVIQSPQERVVLRRYGDIFVIVDLDRSKKTVNQNFTFQAMTADPARCLLRPRSVPLLFECGRRRVAARSLERTVCR